MASQKILHPRIGEIKSTSSRPNLTIVIPIRDSSPVIRLNRLANKDDTTARRSTLCSSCREYINVGDRVTRVNTSNVVTLAASSLPEDIENIICKNLAKKSTIYHSKCAKMNGAYKTRYGRLSQKPVRLDNENFIAGSGFSGCDQYDRGYDRGNFSDYEFRDNIHLTGFVVEDNKEMSPVCIDSEDEGEWESGDDTDEDDEWDESM